MLNLAIRDFVGCTHGFTFITSRTIRGTAGNCEWLTYLGSPTCLVKSWNIGSQYQDCVGVGPMKCMQVTKPNGNPELFYSSIEGFNYQEGFDYQIEVSSTPIANPPADGSSIKYTLVKIISQKPAQ